MQLDGAGVVHNESPQAHLCELVAAEGLRSVKRSGALAG
jgi:hypothetical protein